MISALRAAEAAHSQSRPHRARRHLALEGRDPDETVKAILADGAVRDRLDGLYRAEVLPGFAAHGMGEEAQAYLSTTMDRFLNPFLDHRISDIARKTTPPRWNAASPRS